MSSALPDSSISPARALIDRVEGSRRRDPKSALAELARDFARVSRSASERERGELWRVRGHVLRSLRDARAAVNAYLRAERCYAAARDVRERGRCAIGLVDALLYLGRYGEAMRVARRGRRLLARAGDGVSLGRLLNNEANVLHRLDLPERALERYTQARRSLRRLGDRYEWAQMGVNVGNCLSLLGECGPARRHYRAAERAATAKDRPLDALRAAYNLAYLDFLEHRYEAALESLAAIGERSGTLGYPSIAALARLDRAEILLRLGAHAEADEEARAAESACGGIGLRYEQAKAATFAALAAFRLGRARHAAARLERALEDFHAEGNAVWMGETLVGLATIWWHERQPLAAAALLEAAALHFANARDREREGCARALVVRARLAGGDSRGAGRARVRLAAVERAGRSPRLRQLHASAEAAWARSRGDVAAARRALQRAATESERLAARILDEQWRASFWGEWGWPHRSLAALELEHGRHAEALEALERGRGRALFGTRTRAMRAEGLAARVRGWAASRYARERDRNARGGVPAMDSDAASPGAHGAAAETRATPALRRALALTPPRQLSAAAIQRALPAGVVLLDYLIDDERLSLIATSAERLTGRFEIASEARLASATHEVLFSLRSAAFGGGTPAERAALDAGLERLAALALWPALDAWGGVPAALAIAPAGPLTRIPWAALPLPDGRRLCEAARCAIVPGLRLGLARRVRAAAPEGHPAKPGPAAPLVVAMDAGRLEHVAAEARDVAARYPGALVLEGDQATRARFLKHAPRAPWIHFAGHGIYRPEAPYRSGLQLADGWLSAEALIETRFAAERVVLAACQSARALIQPGEEWFGLARSLLRGGVGQVIATQWDVDDAAARRFMAAFYAGLASGASPVLALAEAQARAAGAGEHPLDWAGFVGLAGPDALAEGPGGSRRGSRIGRNFSLASERSHPVTFSASRRP